MFQKLSQMSCSESSDNLTWLPWAPCDRWRSWDSEGLTDNKDVSVWLIPKARSQVRLRFPSKKREHSCTVGGNANWYSHCGEQCADSWKKLGKELPYDPAIPLLGIHPQETRSETDTCTSLFTAALFTIGRTWKQPKDVCWPMNG